MPVFRYEAADNTGKVLRGAMDAASEQDVAQKLTSMGYTMKAAAPAMPQKAAASAQAAAVARPSKSQSFPVTVQPVIPLSTLMRFYRQLATLVRSGMPLVQSLSDLETSTREGKLKRACADMRSRVQAGEALSAAMAKYPLLFPVHTVGLVWAGEQGGYLDIALDEAATILEEESKDNRWATIGWVFMNLNIASLILCIPTLNFSKILEIAVTSQGGAPVALRAIWSLYVHGFMTMCVPAFILWIGGSIAWKHLKRVSSVRQMVDRMLLMVPGWGKLHRARARERFLKTLFQQYKAGVSLSQGWAAASMTVRNSEIASKLRDVEHIMRSQGGNLQMAFTQSGAFDVEDAGMIGSGERSGSVPEMLERMSSYQADIAARSKIKSRVIAVESMITILIVLTGVVVIAMGQGMSNFFNFFMKWLGL